MNLSAPPPVETPAPDTEPRGDWPTQQHLYALGLCLLAGFFLGENLSRGGFSSGVSRERFWDVTAGLLVLGGVVLRCVDWKKQNGTLFTLNAFAWISWGCFCAVFSGVCGVIFGSSNITRGLSGMLAFGAVHLFGWVVRHPKRAFHGLTQLSWLLVHLPQLILNTRRARARRLNGQ